MAKGTNLLKDSYSEEESPPLIIRHKLYIILIGAAIAGWLLFRGTKGIYIIDQVDAIFAFIILLAFLGRYTTVEIKLHSPTAQFGSISTTFDGRREMIGSWSIIRAGGMKWGYITYPGNDATFIFPSSCKISRGENVSIAASPRFMPKSDLPVIVRNFFEKRKLPEPYYFGIADEKVLKHVPDLDFMVLEFIHTNRYVTRLENELRGIMRHDEESKKWFERMRESSIKRFFKKLGGAEE